jgi:hypothetical protein
MRLKVTTKHLDKSEEELKDIIQRRFDLVAEMERLERLMSMLLEEVAMEDWFNSKSYRNGANLEIARARARIRTIKKELSGLEL